MPPITTLAQKALEAIQAAVPSGKTYFERGQAVINLTKLMPSGSALARALLTDAVWPSAFRDQHFAAWSGNRQYAHLRHIGSGGYQIDYFLDRTDKAVAAEGTTQIEERHIATALVGDDGKFLQDMGVIGAALVTTVTQMEAAPAPTGTARLAAAHETDAVAGIDNRTYLDSVSRQIFAWCRAEGVPCASFFMDTDNFKAFNQQYGHSVGDKILRAVAQTANQAIRLRGGVIGRWGAGDEIVATMSNLTLSEVAALGERIRATVDVMSVDGMKVTISVGVASDVGLVSVEELWDRADKALNEAKRLGKNRVAPHN